MSEQMPTTYIPTTRDLDENERGQLIATFREEYVSLNPGYSQWDLDRATDTFKRQIVEASPAIREYDRRMAERQAERDAADQAEQAKQAARCQAEQDAEMEQERARLLQNWTDAGGTELEFVSRWPALRLQLIEERTLARHNQRLAQTTATWRG